MASFLKISTLLAIVSTLQTTLATPPACLLACVAKIEKESNCSGLNDLNCICSSEASAIEKCLEDICPNNNADAAIDSFRDSCSGYDSASSSSSSSEEESSSTQASSSEATSSSVEASSTEEASSSSSIVVESSSAVKESSSVTAETASSEAPKSTTTTASSSSSSSSSVEEVSSSSSEATSSSTGVITQSEDSAAKVGLGAMIGLIGAALL